MLVVDDLQWADASSISLLFHLARRIGESSILIVGAYRPADVALGRSGERHPLEGVVNEFKRYYGDIRVHLGQAAVVEGRRFVDAWLDTEPNLLGEGFRQYLYNDLGAGERRLLHGEIAVVLEGLYGDQVEEIAAVAGQLARHFQEAGIAEKAIDYLLQAGRRAVRLSAREGDAAQERAEAAIALSTEQGFPFFLTMGTILRGWALAEQGQREEGISQMRHGLAAYRATGAEWMRPYYLAMMAEAYGKRGQVEEELSVLAEALAVVNNSGARRWEAELHRLKGELLLMQGEDESDTSAGLSTRIEACFRDAESCFQHAIDVARSQSAKSLELQAVMSLSCLLQNHGVYRKGYLPLFALARQPNLEMPAPTP
ncbi:MAG: hypothetical protein MAG451_01693 [Anaerolineales bacterium]|nr:hypothetical protein [Anaerolineales bacterium]